MCATCHGGSLHPSGSTPEAAIVRPIVRYHNIQTACPRPATDGFLAVPAAARAQRAHVSNHARQWHDANIHNVGSRTLTADRSDRRSWGDGHHATAGNQQNRAVLSQQFSGDARGRARPLRRVLQARGTAQPAAKSATDSLVERSRGRSRIRDAGGAAPALLAYLRKL